MNIKRMEQLLEEIKPESKNWNWNWKHLETFTGVEIRGVYKGDPECVIRTRISYQCLAHNTKKAVEMIEQTVKKAEDHAIILNTPLFKVMREKED